MNSKQVGNSKHVEKARAGIARFVAGIRRFFDWYGARPAHVIGSLAAFALAGYAALQLLPPNVIGVALWFGGAIVMHDLILCPLYSGADRLLTEVMPARFLAYVRVPAVLSALLLLVFLPLILGLSRSSYERASGQPIDPYLGRWLWLTLILFAGSALLLAARLVRPTDRSQ